MRGSNLLAALFAAGAVAMPIAGDVELTTVTEVDIMDSQGHLIGKKYEVVKTDKETGSSGTPPPANQAQAPAANTPKAAAPPAASTPAPPPKPAGGAVSNLQSGASYGAASMTNALKTGFMETTDPAWQDMVMYHHNVHRGNHSADNLVYGTDLESDAQQWANACVGSEEQGPKFSSYGMNVAFSSASDSYNPSSFISGGWYNSELMNIPAFGNPNLDTSSGGFMTWGHCSQVIWPSTKRVGCAVAHCPNDPTYQLHAACVYDPPGNWDGEFNQMHAPDGHAMVYPNGQTSM